MKFAARVGAVVCGLVAGEAAAGEVASKWAAPAGEVVAHHGEGFVVTNDAAGTVRLYEAGVRALQVAGAPAWRGRGAGRLLRDRRPARGGARGSAGVVAGRDGRLYAARTCAYARRT